MMPFSFTDKNAEKAYLELMVALQKNDGAECAAYPDVFFGNDWDTGARGDELFAKTVCGRCPVRMQCLEYAMIAEDEQGLWGGLTQFERRQLRSLSKR